MSMIIQPSIFTFKKLPFLLGLLLFAAHIPKSGFAQPPLETLIHLDKSFYTTGEIVWFKLYFPFTWEGNNVAINTSILDQNGNTIDQFFIQNQGRSFLAGYYQIPYDLEPGFFEIQFSASIASDQPEQLIAHYSFPVYNDLQIPSDVSILDQVSPSMEPRLFSDEIDIDISLAAGQINCREKVAVNIKVTDQNGNPLSGHASISVKDAALAVSISGESEIKILPLSYAFTPSSLKSSVYSSGRLTNRDGTPLQMNVLGGYVGDDQKIYYSKSFNDGNFQIDLPDFTGKKIIQLVGFQYEQPELRSEMSMPVTKEKKQEITYTKDIIEYLELSRLRKKIYQYYETLESKVESQKIEIKAQELKPDARYSVKEYESFKDMKSFFGELLTPLRFKQEKDSTYIATLFNAKGGRRSNTILNGPPLFIIDGKMTRDADFVAKLPISAVETVELFLEASKLRTYFQAIGVSGVVKISTSIANLKLPDADAGNIHTIYGLQPPADFPQINPKLKTVKEHQPIFRPQLFWSPDVVVESGNASFSFYQSDDTGAFEIKVVFQAKDGRRASKSYQYHVVF